MDSKGRSNLAAVKQYLQHGSFPKQCSTVDKRAVRKRSKTFVFRDNQLYYTGGRPKRIGAEEGEEDTAENPENDPDYTQTLRKCCTTEEEKQEAVMSCHVGVDGTHFGMDKTTERVSSEYYWVGIINTVRKILHTCDFCVARGIRCSASASSNTSASTATTLNNPVITIGSHHENGIKREVEIPEEPDVFFTTQETSNFFWQRVEIQVFGPYAAGRKQVYVAVAMDCYSQFPEAMIIETISSATLTTFVLNLICRYGVMEKLCVMQNKCTRDVYLYINMQDLEGAGITLTYLSLHANSADERWQRVSKTLDNFIRAYPKMWDRCLEAFMMPLRISLPPQADYAPAFLTFNREPTLPEKLSHKSTNSFAELRLTEDEEKETMDLLMTAYGRHNNPPATSATHAQEIDTDLNLVPTVKLEVMPSLPDGNVLNLEESTFVPVTFGDEEQHQQQPPEPRTRRGWKRKDQKPKVPDDAYGGTTDDDDGGFVGDDVEFSDNDEEEDKDETYTPHHSGASYRKGPSGIVTRSSNRKRKPTFKAKAEIQVKKEKRVSTSPSPPAAEAAQLVKRKRGRPPKQAVVEKDPQADKEEPAPAPKSSMKETWGSALTSSGLMNSVELLDLDLYYMVIKSYKERNAYPPRVSVDFKRAVRRLAETVVLKKGKLYGNVGKASGRLIIMKERERFSLLRKAHAKGEEHVGRVRVLKTLLDMNVFWKGMSLDLDAFIHACPECVTNNPLRNKTVVRIPTLSKEVTQKDHEGDMHLSEDEHEECTYEDLLQYLTDGTFLSTTTAEQQACIKERSAKFCLVEGSLYYKPTSSTARVDLRQVLFSDRTKHEAIREAHIEDENHLSQQDTQIKLRWKYFWTGMTYDIMRHVMACCMAEPLAAVPVEHRNPVIQQRVVKFRRYYREGIPQSLGIPETSNGAVAADSAAKDTSEAPEPKEDAAENEEEAEEGGNSETAEENSSGTVTTATNTDSVVLDPPRPAAPKPRAGASDSRTVKEDRAIERAMEAIIVKMGGEKAEDRKKLVKLPKPKPLPARAVAKPLGQLTPEQLRVKKAKAKHKCDHCGRIVKGDVAFKIHLYKHTGIKPFNCNVCGKAFSNRKSQRIHMRKHTGIRPYLCNQCGREFFRSASLRYHLKAHATGRGTPVECDICGRKFTTQHRLNRHKEFKHPAQAKVYMCNQCGKYFTAARSLKRHEQTHTGVRKYQCQYCHKAFFRKEYLNSHLTNHSEYDPQQEKVKPRSKKPSVYKKPQEQDHPQPHRPPETVTVVIPGPSGDSASSASNVIHWAESERQQQQQQQQHPHHRLEERRTVTDMDTYQRQTLTSRPSLLPPAPSSTSSTSSAPVSSAHILTQAHLSHPSSLHHTLHHPIAAHTTRLMNVQGPHGPLSVTVSATPGQPLELVHPGHGHHGHGEILLQHDAVPVQYEVECLSGEAPSLTEADLNAIHLLAQASISGQNLHSM